MENSLEGEDPTSASSTTAEWMGDGCTDEETDSVVVSVSVIYASLGKGKLTSGR